MSTLNTTVQDIIAPTDTQRAIIKARLSVVAATKAWRGVAKVSGHWATGDVSLTELEEAKQVFVDLEIKARDAIDVLDSGMRPSADTRIALKLPPEKDLPNAEALGVLLKVAMPGGGKHTAAIKLFLKG